MSLFAFAIAIICIVSCMPLAVRASRYVGGPIAIVPMMLTIGFLLSALVLWMMQRLAGNAVDVLAL